MRSVPQDMIGAGLVVVLVGGILGFFYWATCAMKRWHRVAAGRCKTCNYDLQESHQRCPECGMPFDGDAPQSAGKLDNIALTKDWPAAPSEKRVPQPDEEMVRVFTADNSLEASLLCQQLEVRGVAAEVGSLRIPSGRGANVALPCVEVPRGDVDRARCIIDGFRRTTV
jgi:hypothetical protein